jgi:hypothetical protein
VEALMSLNLAYIGALITVLSETSMPLEAHIYETYK